MAERVFTQTFCVVGAIIEKNGKILLMKEADPGPNYNKWNQPAGWIDVGENLIEGVKREVKEETGFDFEPSGLLGIYSVVKKNINDGKGTRHAIKLIFLGNISDNQSALAEDSAETRWFTPEEIYEMDDKTLRDFDIKQEVKDYLSGQKFPLEILKHTVIE